MISATTFARGYSSFWQEVAPWLPGFLAHINNTQLEKIGKSVDSLDKADCKAINNLASFILFHKFKRGGDLKKNVIDAISEAKRQIRHLAASQLESYTRSPLNNAEIIHQHNNLKKAYPHISQFNPKFPGYAVIMSCEGDAINGDTLIEIKAADRKFSPADIKQILTYLILNKLSNTPYDLSRVELYNPRHAMKFSTSTEELCSDISNYSFAEMCSNFENFVQNIVITSK